MGFEFRVYVLRFRYRLNMIPGFSLGFTFWGLSLDPCPHEHPIPKLVPGSRVLQGEVPHGQGDARQGIGFRVWSSALGVGVQGF